MAKRVFENNETPQHSEGATMMKSELPTPKSDKQKLIPICVVVGVLLIAAIVFISLAFAEKHEDKNIDDMWDGVRTVAGAPQMGEETSVETQTATTSVAESGSDKKEPLPGYSTSEAYSKDPLVRTIDWDALLNINKDVLCWVYAPGTQINYPVMQEQVFDEAFYLNHNIYKVSQKSGAIFTPAQLQNNTKDMHLLLYGHHMKSGSMFGSLTKYKDPKFCEANPYIYLYYPDRTEKWQIWTAEQVKSTDKVYIIPYSYGSVEYDELLRNMEKNSIYKTDLFGVDAVTETLVLSTCDHSANGAAGRFIVGAVMVDSVKPGNGYVPEKPKTSDSKKKVDPAVIKDMQDSLELSDDEYEGYDVTEGNEYDVVIQDHDEIVTVDDNAHTKDK